MGKLANIGLIFYNPSAVAGSVDEKPQWILPVVIIMILGFVAVYASYQYTVDYQRQVFEKVQRDRGTNLDADNYLKATPGKRVFAGVVAGMGMVIGVVISAAILHGLALVLGGKSVFAKIFSLYAYAAVIPGVGGLAKLPLILAKKSIDVRTSLAALAPGVKFDSPLGVLLNSTDLFYIWMLAVTVVGYSILTGLGRKKSALIVIGLYLLFVVFSVSMTLLRSKITG